MATYGQLSDPNLASGLKALVNCNQEVSGSLATLKIVRFLEAERATLRDLHRHIINKYGSMVEGTEQFKIAEENAESYREDILKLYNTQIEGPTLPLKLSVKKLELTPLQVGALEPFFEITCLEN